MEAFLLERYRAIVAGANLPQSIKDTLNSRDPCTLDDLDEAYADLIHQLQHADYYNVLARIEQGEAFMAQQTEPSMIAKCRKRLNELAIELEQHRPKEESA